MVGFVAARPTALGGRRMWDVTMTMIPGSEAEGLEILVASRGALGPPTL